MIRSDKQHGFTLIELMVALLASMFLLAGISLAYSSMSTSSQITTDLENNLDVVRFSSTLFTRSLKQTAQLPSIVNGALVVRQKAGTRACTGTRIFTDYSETFSVQDDSLFCDIGNGNIKVIKGLTAINFSINNDLVRVVMTPINLPTQFNGQVQLDIALSQVIMNKAFK
ncbi:PilW family protein [Pseudoalteromonas mariniglutinosa]|uniref:PilW family protein n=1 Tax=Pseudoalteromonas mariniglutinosa TaxID=206042 RepID=UPI003850E2C1